MLDYVVTWEIFGGQKQSFLVEAENIEGAWKEARKRAEERIKDEQTPIDVVSVREYYGV